MGFGRSCDRITLVKSVCVFCFALTLSFSESFEELLGNLDSGKRALPTFICLLFSLLAWPGSFLRCFWGSSLVVLVPGAAARALRAAPLCLFLFPIPPLFSSSSSSFSVTTPAASSRAPLPKINKPVAPKGSRHISHISQKFNTELF